MKLGRIVGLSFLLVIAAFCIYQAFENHITIDKCYDLGYPVLIIDTHDGKKPKDKEKYLKGSYSLNEYSGKMKIKGHGNTTWRTRELYKKPYLLKLDEEAPLLGMKSASKWILIANAADKSSLRNAYSTYLAKDVFDSVYSPDTRFVTLFFNGRYEGLYALTEKIDIETVLDVPGAFLAEVHSQRNKENLFETNQKQPFCIRSPDCDEKQFTEWKNKIQTIEDIIYNENTTFEDLDNILDIPSFIDWYLINEYAKNHDAAFQSSCFMYWNPLKKKLFMGPVWDFDIAWGNISWDSCDKVEGLHVNSKGWYAKLFENKEFYQAVKNRWNEKYSELKASVDWINSSASELSTSISLNDAVWKNIGKRQWPHAPGWKKRKTYKTEIDFFTDWCNRRIEWLNKEYN